MSCPSEIKVAPPSSNGLLGANDSSHSELSDQNSFVSENSGEGILNIERIDAAKIAVGSVAAAGLIFLGVPIVVAAGAGLTIWYAAQSFF